MSMAAPAILFATISSLLCLKGSAIAQNVQVTGDCNFVAPQLGVGQSNVTFQITCNNTSPSENEKISEILEMISILSSRAPDVSFEEQLRALLSDSRETLEELRRSSSPRAALSIENSSDCTECDTRVNIVSTGGSISRILDFETIEVFHVRMFTAQPETKQVCPFRNSSESDWITIDRPRWIIGFSYDRSFSNGDTILSLETSSAIQLQENIRRSVFDIYNRKRNARDLPIIDYGLFSRCAVFEYEAGIRFLFSGYTGVEVPEYFFFGFEYNTVGRGYEQSRFRFGRQGFEALASEHSLALAARSFEGGGQTEYTSAIAEKLMSRTFR